jgi:viologen exporter family transport system permease protein
VGDAAVYARIVRAQVRAQAQYKVSFTVDLIATTLALTLDLVTVLVLFRVTRTLAGFGFPQAFLMAGIAMCGFALADMVIGNIDRLRFTIRTGLLDAVLVRPLGVLGQLLAMDFAPRRIGRAVQGVAVYGIGLALAHVTAAPAHVVMAVLAPLCGAVFFCAWFIAGATVAFWWIDSGEFANGFTYGGRDFTTYPLTVYSGLFRRLFGFGLGFGFVAYYPALVLLDRPDPLGLPAWTGWTAPLVAALTAVAAAAIWRFGVRHYRSTGS